MPAVLVAPVEEISLPPSGARVFESVIIPSHMREGSSLGKPADRETGYQFPGATVRWEPKRRYRGVLGLVARGAGTEGFPSASPLPPTKHHQSPQKAGGLPHFRSR